MTLKARITAVDRFIKGLKEDGIYADLNAACVMAGWDSLAGALTPLKGAAPTNSGFLAADFDRGIGLTGDGSSKYLDSNRANNADGRDDQHMGVYITSPNMQNVGIYIGSDPSSTVGANQISVVGTLTPGALFSYSRIVSGPEYDATEGEADQIGLSAISRSESDSYYLRTTGQSLQKTRTSATPSSSDIFVFDRGPSGGAAPTDATISFYSIGSSLGSDPAAGLAALDARVSTLMADLRAIEEAGFDRDALGYLRAVEEADGAFLETSVKIAVNNLVSGLKADGLWESMASTCLLCGPRTLAGALVPLRGDAPTSYGFVEGDYDRLGLTGDYTSYLDTGYAYDQNQDNEHMSLYRSAAGATTQNWMGAGNYDSRNGAFTRLSHYSSNVQPASQANLSFYPEASPPSGFAGVSRSGSAVTVRYNGSDRSQTVQSKSVSGITSTFAVFAVNYDDLGVVGYSTQKASFYSIGTSIDLAKLDSHISSYVTAIGAAL
jgi:hypothetical protein